MNTSLARSSRNRALAKLRAEPRTSIRRIFNNDQLIERFGRWLLVCGKAENTRISYIFTAKQFAKFLVNKPLTAATKEDVRDFIGSLYTRGLAASTMQARLDALRVLFDCLALGGQVRASVPRYILRRKLPKRLPHAKSEEEIERLIAAARTPRDRALIELGYASALRVSELAHLNVEDLNLRARSLIVRRGKGGDDRVGLFGRQAAEALSKYLGRRQSGPLWAAQTRIQQGCVCKCKRSWIFSYLENRILPDGSVKRVRRSKTLGMDGETKRRGPNPFETITLAAKLRRSGRKWPQIFKAVSPDVEMSRQTRRALRNSVYYRLDNSKRKPLQPAKQITSREQAKVEAHKLVAKLIKFEQPRPQGRLSVRGLYRDIVKVAKRAGISGMHPHVLRHSCATHCLNRGMDIRFVQDLLGHTSLMATQKYLHLATANLKRIHDKFFPRG